MPEMDSLPNQTNSASQPFSTPSVNPETTPAHVATPPTHNGPWYFLLFLLLAITLGLGAYIFRLQRDINTLKEAEQMVIPGQTAPPTPSPATSNQPQPIVFLNDGSNVVLYDPATDTLKPITSDANQPRVWYNQPTFINPEKVAYQRCVRNGSDQTDPYTCDVVVHTLKSGEQISVFVESSVPNENKYQIGAELLELAAHPTGEFLVAVHASTTDNTDTQATVIDLSTRTYSRFASFGRNPGRGGSFTDDNSLEFSPDGKYLLLTMTSLLPNEDESSMVLYSADSLVFKELWRSPKSVWWTYGKWRDSNTFLALRETGSDEITGQVAQLISIDVPTLQEKIVVDNASQWFNIEPLSSTEVSYFKLNKDSGTGTSFLKYSLQSQQETVITQNVIPLLNSGKFAYVYTMAPCPAEGCGMDLFNGVQQSGFGIVDTQEQQLKTKPVPPYIQYPEALHR